MDGSSSSCTVRIDSLLHGTWQGRLLYQGREYRFFSELELLLLIDRLFVGTQIDWEGTQ